MTTARSGMKVKVIGGKVVGQANAVGLTSIEGLFSTSAESTFMCQHVEEQLSCANSINLMSIFVTVANVSQSCR